MPPGAMLYRHKAVVTRDTGKDVDVLGQTTEDFTTIHQALTCHVVSRVEIVKPAEQAPLPVAIYTLYCSPSTDIKEEDRVTQVTDVRGDVIWNDKMRVIAALPRRQHLEATLQTYAGGSI